MLRRNLLAVVSALLLAAVSILPARAAAATITVTGDFDDAVTSNLSGNGFCDLREALENANAGNGAWTDCAASSGGPDTIAFSVLDGGANAISLAASLPVSQNGIIIDATTQPGYSGVPLIRLIGGAFDTLSVSSDNVTIKGLVLINGTTGIKVNSTADGTIIQGNYIGTDGATAALNSYGVYLASATNTLIGGTGTGQGNVISGNGEGVWFQGGTYNAVFQGNKVGTNAAGTAAIPNGVGLTVNSYQTNTIGGPGAGQGNLISGNSTNGINVFNAMNGAIIQGNWIGTDASGMAALPNVGSGIVLVNAQNVLIGGPSPATGNVIAHHNTVGYPAVNIGDVGSMLSANSSNNCLFDNLVGAQEVPATSVVFENNWWGDASGPFNATSNPSGLGDPVSDNIDYVPFLSAPPSVCAFVFEPGPVLSSPKNGAALRAGKKITFKWKKLKPATQYEFQLADALAGFGSPLMTGTAVKPSFPVPAGLGYGAYQWRVRGSAGLVTAYSSPRPFFVTIMKSPAYDKTLKHTSLPKFSWRKFPGATSYTLRVSDSPTCSTSLHDYTLLPKTSYKVPDPLSPTVHYWQVTPDNGPTMPCWPFTLTP